MNPDSAGPICGAIADLARAELVDSDNGGRTLLGRAWLGAVTRELRRARCEAGLSQQEVAERLGTTQSAIARLERDREGRFSVHTLVEYALAIGWFPFDFELAPFETIRALAIAHPDAPRDARGVQGDHFQRDAHEPKEVGKAQSSSSRDPAKASAVSDARQAVGRAS